MRFIIQEEIITTLCNKEVADSDSISKLLERLLKERVEFSLSINKLFNSDYNRRIICYDKTRVQKVNEDSGDFLVFQRSSMVTIKDIKFSEITEIFARTKKTGLAVASPDSSRWNFLDITEDDSE